MCSAETVVVAPTKDTRVDLRATISQARGFEDLRHMERSWSLLQAYLQGHPTTSYLLFEIHPSTPHTYGFWVVCKAQALCAGPFATEALAITAMRLLQ